MFSFWVDSQTQANSLKKKKEIKNKSLFLFPNKNKYARHKLNTFVDVFFLNLFILLILKINMKKKHRR